MKFKEKFHPFDVVKNVGGIDSNFFDLIALDIANETRD